MSWHTHHHLRRIDASTYRAAAASESVLDGQRRTQLEAAGLIDFNAPADVVRALERRLAVERGDPVRKMFDLALCRNLALWGGLVFVIGLIVGGVVHFNGTVGAVGGLVLAAGGCVSVFGFAEINVSGRLHADQDALEAYQAGRGSREIGP